MTATTSASAAVDGHHWQQFIDKNTGRTYYHNTSTNETSWTIPDALKMEKKNTVDVNTNAIAATVDNTAAAAATSAAVVAADVVGNVASKADDTMKIVNSNNNSKKKKKKKKKKKNKKSNSNDTAVNNKDNNTITDGQSQQQQQHHENDKKELSSSEWKELIDETTGKTYYFNQKTQETTWDKPSSYSSGNKEETPEQGIDRVLDKLNSVSELLVDEEQQQQQQNTLQHKRKSIARDDSSVRLAFEKRGDSFLKPLTKQNSLQSFKIEYDEHHHERRPFAEQPPSHFDQTDSSGDSDDDNKAKENGVGRVTIATNPADEVDSVAGSLPAGPNPLLNTSRAQMAHQRLMERRRTVAYNQSQVVSFAGHPSIGVRQKSNSVASRSNSLPLEATGTHTTVLYAEKHLQRFKRSGLFKKKKIVSAEKTMSWSSKLVAPMHNITNPKHYAVALQCFEIIQQYMGDKKTKKQRHELAKELLEIALLYVQLRNEINCQLLKQCTKNPKEQSTLRGMQLLYLMTSCFPPTVYELQEALLYFLQENQKKYPPLSPHFEYAKQTEKTLRRMVATGPRKTLPKSFDAEITQQVPIFGVTIEEYMNWQQEMYGNSEVTTSTTISIDDESFLDGGEGEGDPSIVIGGSTNRIIKPKILEILMDKLLEMDGFSSEGIFRKPGSTSEVEKLKDRFSNGDLSTDGVEDVHTIASLLKLWLRELVEPIIPDELYDLCVEVSRDKNECVRVLGHLPLYNRSILIYVCQFLHKMTDPEVSKRTKMTIENLAVVFSPNIIRNQSTDPMTIMKNSPLEQEFVRNLILNIK